MGSRKLGAASRWAIERGANTVLVSAVSAWEIAIKSRLGQLTLAEPPPQVREEGLTLVTADAAFEDDGVKLLDARS